MKPNRVKFSYVSVVVPLFVVPSMARAVDLTPVAQPAAKAGDEWGEKLEGFQMSLKTKKKRYTLGEAVNLSVVDKNVDRQLVWLVQRLKYTYKLEILRPDGTLAPLTPAGEENKKSDKSARAASGLSKPGDKNGEELRSMNLYFDMTQIGDYQLRVSRSVPKRPENMKDEKDKETTLVSNVIVIRIEAPKAKDDATQEDAEATDDAPQDNEVAVTEVAPD